MQIQMNALMKGLGSFLLTGEERFQRRIVEARQAFSHFLQVYQVVLLSSEEKGWADDLIRLSNRSLANAYTITELQVRRSSGLTEFMGQYTTLGSRIDDTLLQHTSINLAGAKRDLVEAGGRANSTILAVLLAGMIFGIGAAVITARQITSPLRHLISVMNGVDNDGHGREIELRSSDEFRQVGDSFNTMMRRLIRANENLRDEIVERRKVEADLKETELRFRTIFEDAPIGVALADAQGIILQANERLLDILRCTALDDLRGKTLESALGSTPVVRGSKPDDPLRYRLEMRGVRADGTPSWISVNVSHVLSETGGMQYSIIMMEDLTAQHELQQQLAEAERVRLQGIRLFAQSVQRAQEEERSRIARELHDDICQRLTGMKYRVEVLEAGAGKLHQRVARQLGTIRQELDRSLIEVRRISSNLRPSVLDDFGLVTALRILSREFRESRNILTTIRVDPAISGRIDAESETAIFRITQQALTNIAHHSKATSVSISLDIRGVNLLLRIVDNGKGFTLPEWGSSGASGNGFGLVSMRERAELLGGNFLIESNLEQGTTVTVTIPLREA
jgi:PAS domain S-box-containing protein